MPKQVLKSLKKVKKSQNHLATNQWVIWLISKKIKIPDQCMESHFFALCLKICSRGLAFKLRASFLRFSKIGLFVNILQICFLRDRIFWSISRFLILKDPSFEVKKLPSKSQKVKHSQNYVLTNHGVIWKILKVSKNMTKVWN